MAGFSAYLTFPGCTPEAFTLYQQIFGGELMLWSHGQVSPPVLEDLPADIPPGSVAHAELSGGYVALHGGDERADPPRPLDDAPFHLVLTLDTPDEADTLMDRLLEEGGTAERTLRATPEGHLHGAVRDRFGVLWAVEVPPGTA
ncbi:glyoxalase/bleomycin resistance/extradiol dioxygenase family protein [Brachybacterium sp. YJGR34]|uniref:VOC family protein n=1 Tax=Brachybacterium sp. YJGR34 TaxID=2059911 RepID=UPI000E0A3C42|nr:VOC family protein [Brachybacterium sp. YJGR34]